MNETVYTFEDWYRPTEFKSAGHYYYDSLLTEVLGEESVLFFVQEADYQGDWHAFVSDGARIGLVEGSFGSCSGCDDLENADYGGGPSVSELVQDYLKAVRTFSSWEDVLSYLKESAREDYWSFRNVRPQLIEFVSERVSERSATQTDPMG